MPFLFASLAMQAVGRVGGQVVEEVRRQFREIPGIMEGTARPEYGRAIDIVTGSAIRSMLLPALIPIGFPIVVGIINYRMLGGLLIGTIVTGLFLAIAMTSGGGAWDSAEKLIEDGLQGGQGTVRYPEAGGSASFARHAFNELVSFGAAWAQMLNYVITIAISAFFVPHYLSIFWAPLKQNPWDIIGGALVIVVLVGLNIVGIQESARVNIFLALIDFSTQVLLVILGFVLILSPSTITHNVHFGVAPTWS